MSTTAQLRQPSSVSSASHTSHEERKNVQTTCEAPVTSELQSFHFFLGGIAWAVLMIICLLVSPGHTAHPSPLFCGVTWAVITAAISLMGFSEHGQGTKFTTVVRVTFVLAAGTMLPFALCHLAGMSFNN